MEIMNVVNLISSIISLGCIVFIVKHYIQTHDLTKKEKDLDLRFQEACIEGKMIAYGYSREQAEIRYKWKLVFP